jgi:single-stranded-DNA-specific exonuclease
LDSVSPLDQQNGSPTGVVWQPRNPRPAPPPSGLPRLVWEVMSARGFETEEAIQKWLSPSLKILKDPYTLTDMDKAVQRLVKARECQEPLVIYADYDLDGTSGLALLLKAFELMGFRDVAYYQPKRLTEGYGIHREAIQKLYDSGRRLLLSIDLGITAVEEVEFAKSLGMEAIITDHHLPKEKLPEAVAVVNPNRGNCESGLSHLCGTGVAFYLVLALRRALLEEGLLPEPFDPKILLDCFVIGTVTDMVPLVDENRVLVKHGLLQLAQTKRPGLRVLMQALGLWGIPLTSQDVAIRFAPKLNALSRMEMGIQPIDLYLVDDEAEAQRLVETVLSNNQDRQAWQRSAETEAMEGLRKNPPGSSIFVYSAQFHRGVVGLVATKLCQEFGLPTFVGSLGEDGAIVGSARMPDGRGINALDAMAFASQALEQFGGHAAAAGFELKVENAEIFREKIEAFFAKLSLEAQPRTWIYDAEASLEELNENFMTWYEHLSPFGVQFAPPVFCVRNVQLQQVKNLKGGHYRLTLGGPGLPSRTALWFSPPKEHPLLVTDLAKAGRVDALVEPQWNYYSGRRTLQLLVQDLRSAT